jgi:hypothetical protein
MKASVPSLLSPPLPPTTVLGKYQLGRGGEGRGGDYLLVAKERESKKKKKLNIIIFLISFKILFFLKFT